MKPLPWFLAAAFLLSAPLSFAQEHMMNISKGLKSNGEFMSVKVKAFTTKYEFGPYRIVSCKKGFTKTTTNGWWWEHESTSTNASSFVFVANDKDSVVVNVNVENLQSVSTSRLTIRKGHKKSTLTQSEVNPIFEDMDAAITFINDTTEWQLGRHMNYIEPDSSYFGLSNGTTEIYIWEKNDAGRMSVWQLHGYEFFIGKKPIAAVQTFSKRYVWIDRDLDEKTSLLLLLP